MRIDVLSMGDKQAVCDWLKGHDKEMLLVRRIVTNKDGSTDVLNPMSSNVTLDGESAVANYQITETLESERASQIIEVES